MASIASDYLADMLAPEQFAAAIFGVTLAFTILAGNTVAFRSWARIRNKKFGNDDYLMCTALLVNVVQNAIVMHGTFVGIGSPDSKLNPELETEGKKVRVFFCFFLTPCCLIKQLAKVSSEHAVILMCTLIASLSLANLLYNQPGLHQNQYSHHT